MWLTFQQEFKNVHLRTLKCFQSLKILNESTREREAQGEIRLKYCFSIMQSLSLSPFHSIKTLQSTFQSDRKGTSKNKVWRKINTINIMRIKLSQALLLWKEIREKKFFLFFRASTSSLGSWKKLVVCCALRYWIEWRKIYAVIERKNWKKNIINGARERAFIILWHLFLNFKKQRRSFLSERHTVNNFNLSG